MSNPIRVAMICRPAVGGMRQHVDTLVSGLVDRGIGVTLVAPADQHPAIPAGVEVLPLPDPGARTGQGHGTMAAMQAATAAADLVHVHGIRLARTAAAAAKVAAIPCVVTLHNEPPGGAVARYVARCHLRSADALICVSHAIGRVAKTLCAPGTILSVIPNGINAAVFATSGAPAPGRLLCAGRLTWEKGFDVAIEAMRLAARQIPGLRLVICGAGAEQVRLAELAAAVCSGLVEFRPWLRDMAAEYGTAECVLVPSRREGQGMVALEAMAAGRPVIASAVGGLPETVIDGMTGLLVPPDNPRLLASAIVRLMDNPDLRAAFSRAGAERVQTCYTVAGMVAATVDVYQAAMAGRGANLQTA